MITVQLIDDNVSSQTILSNSLENLTLREKVGILQSAVTEESTDLLFVSAEVLDWEIIVEDLIALGKGVVLLSYDPIDALIAIKRGAFGFILKPLDNTEVESVISRWIQHSKENKNPHLRSAINKVQNNKVQNNRSEYYGVHLNEGISILKKDDIYRIEADNNYSVIHTKDGDKIISSKTLKYFEENIDSDVFIRIHKSHIININQLKWIESHSSGLVVLRNGEKISIARRKKSSLLARLNMV